MNNEMIELIKSRRSIRKFTDEQITDEQLGIILEAGTYAPTGLGAQKPLMVAVQNPEIVQMLSKINASIMNTERDPMYGAKTVIVVFGDGDSGNCIQDASCVMSTLLNAVHAVGLGGCWINRAKETFETPEGIALKKEWGIPENYVGVGNCIVGYIDGPLLPAKPRKDGYYKIIK